MKVMISKILYNKHNYGRKRNEVNKSSQPRVVILISGASQVN